VAALAACTLLRPDDPAAAARGIYHVRLPAADTAGRIVTLWVQDGGVATLETVHLGRPDRQVAQGRWAVRERELTLELLDGRGEPDTTLVYEVQPDRLVPVRWDRDRWGAAGLPLRRR
jgi:hypothetical protein